MSKTQALNFLDADFTADYNPNESFEINENIFWFDQTYVEIEILVI